ncbi:hypothetical protein [Candidatus Ruminimicrobiellum ovillum]|uniref:hypothetical protein n=1 Tax=Candidatus Ruminimicrobiellum ovillum TaxID=1947927 RepID=UPI003559FC56
MQKLLSTLLTIIFFQTSIFAFPVSFPFLCFPNTTTKATIGNGKIIVGGQEQTEEDLQGLNRDVNNSQTITKDQITAALDAELNVDITFLVSLADAIYNGDPNKLSLVKDYNKAKKSINEIKQKIQEKLTEKRRTELEKNIKKIKFSKDKEKQKEIENKLLLDEEIQKLQAANDNKKILKEYLKKNKISNEVTEKLEKIGATGEYSYGINGEGKLYAVKTSEADSARNNIFLSTDYLYNDITTNEKFLSIFLPGSYEEIYAGTMREASKSMAEILLETSPQLRNISDDTTQIVKDTGNLILEMAKSSGDKQTYKTALKAIKEIPNSLKETYYATTNVSNVENLQSLGYNIGDRVYDYKENPMLFVKDSARIITSYDMYEAGFNNDNMFYGSALVLGGLALDIAGAPIKAGKGFVKTAKATEKIANATKELKVAENLAKDSSKYLRNDATETALVYGSEKGFTTIGESVKFSILGKTATQKEISNYLIINNLNKENLFRYISKEEFAFIKENNLISSFSGENYFTNKYYSNAIDAQQKLALPTTPDFGINFKIINNPNITKQYNIVEPKFSMPGGGIEFMSQDKIEIKIIDSFELKKQ